MVPPWGPVEPAGAGSGRKGAAVMGPVSVLHRPPAWSHALVLLSRWRIVQQSGRAARPGPPRRQVTRTVTPTSRRWALAALVEFRERPITAMLLIVLGAIASLIFAQRRHRLWVTAGIGYAGAMLLAPMFLRADPDYGLFALLLLFGVVWTTDIMAYFTGRALGGPKL